MSAHAYIQWADVPQPLIKASHQRIDGETGDKLITFSGCPISGHVEEKSDGQIQVEFPFPRGHDLRNTLIDWLMHWDISFTVVM